MLTLLTTLLLLATPQADAEQDGDWLKVGGSNTRDVWINVKSIRRSDKPDQVIAWARWTRMNGTLETVFRKRLDCAAETTTLLAFTDYDAAQKVKETASFLPRDQQEQPVQPGTIDAELFRAGCNLIDEAPPR